jgi:hypothetical protein
MLFSGTTGNVHGRERERGRGAGRGQGGEGPFIAVPVTNCCFFLAHSRWQKSKSMCLVPVFVIWDRGFQNV